MNNLAIEPTFTPTDNASLKVLGAHWDLTTDSFRYHTNVDNILMTKRSVLSTFARLYGPIGVLGPVLLWSKGVMQELWVEKLEWDSPLPASLRVQWRQFLDELSLLSRVAIPLCVNALQVKEVQMVGFSDAS